MLYVKIMSAEDMEDTDIRKHYTIVPIENNEVMAFAENEGWDTANPPFPRYVLEVHAPDGGHERHALTGNAYVLNEGGKTIASHSA